MSRVIPPKKLTPLGTWERAAWRLMAVLVLVVPATSHAEPPPPKEYQIKAACLFHFVEFVEWPATAFPDDHAPICIGILGEDPFGPALDATLQGETIHNRQIVVLRSKHLEDLTACHLVFVSRTEKARIPEIFARLSHGSVLTVSEIDGFARQGGTINFYFEGRKVRFEINPESALEHNLKLSSRLLSLGTVVTQTGAGNKE